MIGSLAANYLTCKEVYQYRQAVCRVHLKLAEIDLGLDAGCGLEPEGRQLFN
jgi:hypothetical protein